MKKAFRKSLKRQASIGYFSTSSKAQSRTESHHEPVDGQAPVLWQTLARKYQFNYPKDWYRIEAHWLDQIESFQEQPIDCPGRDGRMNNALTRISQCNESYQLCNSLPRSFIVPKDLKDFTLMNSMSTVIKDHRVPIISYCCPIEYRRNFIIRCASSDQQTRVVDILNKVVKPLKVFNLTSLAPTSESVETAHRKLRDVCRPSVDQANNFISKSGKWLNIVSLALKLVNETARTLLTEASVILFEDDDQGWNSVVSSLIQLVLEPHRRTVDGIESLISKEWIYLSGGTNSYAKPDVLFTLFLDCTYQIYLQNPTKFEFTSEYLRFLFEAQYTYTSIQSVDHNQTMNSDRHSINRSIRTNGKIIKNITSSSYAYDREEEMINSEPASYKLSSVSAIDLNLSINEKDRASQTGENSTHGYSVCMFNPFYEPDSNCPILEVYDHIVNMKLWASLYLRWQPSTGFGCVEESFYFQLYPPNVGFDTIKST